jgi:hypothetical protein
MMSYMAEDLKDKTFEDQIKIINGVSKWVWINQS